MLLMAYTFQWWIDLLKDFQIPILFVTIVSFVFLWRQMKATELQGKISNQMLRDSIRPILTFLPSGPGKQVQLFSSEKYKCYDANIKISCSVKNGFLRLFCLGIHGDKQYLYYDHFKSEPLLFSIRPAECFLIDGQTKEVRLRTHRLYPYIYLFAYYVDRSNNLYSSVAVLNAGRAGTTFLKMLKETNQDERFINMSVSYDIDTNYYYDHNEFIDPTAFSLSINDDLQVKAGNLSNDYAVLT
jgi:hypothetical protein